MATHYIHGVGLPGRSSKYSAYFETVPHWSNDVGCSLTRIVDAERIDRLGRSMPCTEAEMADLWHRRWGAEPYSTYRKI